MKAKQNTMDIVGVGIGPANLGLAALLSPTNLTYHFFEQNPELQWHSGLMFSEATIQNSFLRDPVTLADPKSAYSFLSFLKAHKRLYRFINSDFQRVTRREYNQYLRWVSDQVSGLSFGNAVENVACSDEECTFVITVDGQCVHARNIVLGTGLSPVVPQCGLPHLGRTAFHASSYLKQDITFANMRVAVIGGGQTAAEIVSHILASDKSLPSNVAWVSRRPNLLPLDESPFTNELFSPAYSEYFFQLSPSCKHHLLAQQKYASDGISQELLERIYRRLYELEFMDGWRSCALYPANELVAMQPARSGWKLQMRCEQDHSTQFMEADLVIFCTGYEYRLPTCMQQLANRICWSTDGFQVRKDFTLEWDGPSTMKIFVQNAAKHARGIADPNLSLMAWRSAQIVNSLLGYEWYDIGEESSVFDWNQETDKDQESTLIEYTLTLNDMRLCQMEVKL